MFNQIGPLEIGIVLVIVLLIFGPKRLPGLGKSLGTGMREFKDSITGKDGDDSTDADTPAERASLARAEEPVRESETPAPTADQRN
jgi:sec-independent protein translocase protein TatA